MTVGFAGADSVDDTACNFVYAADTEADPSTILPDVDDVMAFKSGSINRMAGVDGAQFGADFEGTLNAPVDVDGGFFYDCAIAGVLGGTVTPDGGSSTEIEGVILVVEQ